MSYSEINNLKQIKHLHKNLIKSEQVSIFMHESPDFDAFCSSLALREYLLAKKIAAKIIGMDKVDESIKNKIYEPFSYDEYDDEYIKQSTAVILDTANKERVLTKKHKLAKDIIRIDHHPKIETIGNIELIEDKVSSTCELIGWLIILNDKKNFNKRIANFLYTGILADSGRLMYSCTNKTTLQLLCHFYDVGFDKQEVQDKMFSKKWEDVLLDSELISKIKIEKNIGSLIIDQKLSKKIKKIKNNLSKVYLMNDINGLKIWTCAYFDEDIKMWKISLRSKKYNVKKIAEKYHGGGHVLAAGIKFKTFKEVQAFLTQLKKIKIEPAK